MDRKSAMKLNCDMGESFGVWKMGDDQAVMPWVDMANIACGFHASDADIMAQTITWAKAHNVEIGAHPGYDDKKGFGRRSIPHALTSITQLVSYQAGALDALCQLQNCRMTYIKPHGALYLDMMSRPDVFDAILTAVAGMNSARERPLKLVILAKEDNSIYQSMAQNYQVELLLEAFADRAYDENGVLVDRTQPGAVFRDIEQIKQQALNLQKGYVVTTGGLRLPLRADTLCVHGDNPASIAIIAQLRNLLSQPGSSGRPQRD